MNIIEKYFQGSVHYYIDYYKLDDKKKAELLKGITFSKIVGRFCNFYIENLYNNLFIVRIKVQSINSYTHIYDSNLNCWKTAGSDPIRKENYLNIFDALNVVKRNFYTHF